MLLATELGRLMEASLLTEALEASDDAPSEATGALIGAEVCREGAFTGADARIPCPPLEPIGSFCNKIDTYFSPVHNYLNSLKDKTTLL